MRTTTIIETYVTCLECGQETKLTTIRHRLQIARHQDMRGRRSRVRRFNAPVCPSSNTKNYDVKSTVRRDAHLMYI